MSFRIQFSVEMEVVWLRLVAYVCFLQLAVNADRYSQEMELHDKLFQRYNINVRPPGNSMGPNIINTTFFFLGLKEYDDKAGRLSFSGVFHFEWFDENLKWNLTEYNSTYRIRVRKNKVWTPTLTMTEPYYELKPLGYDDDDIDLTILSTGKVMYDHGGIFHSECAADVTYFPFDTQSCQVNFVPMYFSYELNFTLVYQDFALDHFVKGNGMWNITRASFIKENSAYNRNSLSQLHFHLEIKRVSLFYILNIILPINFICQLNLFIFLLPRDSGERIGFSVTMLLAMALFLTIVADRLPESSRPSILIFLLLAKFGVSGMILICVILGAHYQHRTNNAWACFHRMKLCNRRTTKKEKEMATIDTVDKCICITVLDLEDTNTDRNKKMPVGRLQNDRILDIVFTFVFVTLYLAIVLTYIIVYWTLW